MATPRESTWRTLPSLCTRRISWSKLRLGAGQVAGERLLERGPVVDVDAPQPAGLVVGDLLRFEAEHAFPARREEDPVAAQVPLPQSVLTAAQGEQVALVDGAQLGLGASPGALALLGGVVLRAGRRLDLGKPACEAAPTAPAPGGAAPTAASRRRAIASDRGQRAGARSRPGERGGEAEQRCEGQRLGDEHGGVPEMRSVSRGSARGDSAQAASFDAALQAGAAPAVAPQRQVEATRVPRPGALSIRSRPPCSSTMRRAIASPRPPWPLPRLAAPTRSARS